jgi:hypothetical protein
VVFCQFTKARCLIPSARFKFSVVSKIKCSRVLEVMASRRCLAFFGELNSRAVVSLSCCALGLAGAGVLEGMNYLIGISAKWLGF